MPLPALIQNAYSHGLYAYDFDEHGLRVLGGPPNTDQVVDRAAQPETTASGLLSELRQWFKGPRDPAGRLLRLSDRPVVCAAVEGAYPYGNNNVGTGSRVVLGCTDHAAYVVDAASGTLVSTLYGKTAGHREWVTGACFVGDGSGRVATCGMDGRVLVWPAPPPSARGHTAAAAATQSSPSSSSKAWRGPGPCELGPECHFGSVSLVASPPPAAPGAAAMLVSGGYDKTLRVWGPATTSGAGGTARVGRGGWWACTGVLRGLHEGPVLVAAILPGHTGGATGRGGQAEEGGAVTIASGDRCGRVCVWVVDGTRPGVPLVASALLPEGHGGHVTSLLWVPLPGRAASGGAEGAGGRVQWALLSGGQDGCVRVHVQTHAPPSSDSSLSASASTSAASSSSASSWRCVSTIPAHASPGGSGAVSDMGLTFGGGAGGGCAPQQLVVTAGADKALCVLDPANGWAVRHRLPEHTDFIYSLTVFGGLALSGSGNGTLICHDVASGRPLWGLGANTAAVRTITVACGGNRLVVSGDDGAVLVYDFSA